MATSSLQKLSDAVDVFYRQRNAEVFRIAELENVSVDRAFELHEQRVLQDLRLDRFGARS